MNIPLLFEQSSWKIKQQHSQRPNTPKYIYRNYGETLHSVAKAPFEEVLKQAETFPF